MKDTGWISLGKPAACGKDQMTSFGKVCGEFSPMEGNPMLEQRKNVRSPLHEGEGVAKNVFDELTVVPISHPSVGRS